MPKQNISIALWLSTGGLAVMAAMSAAVHEVAKFVPTGQIIFWRSFVALVPILIYLAIRRELGQAVRTRYPHKHLVRGLLGCAVMFFSFVSLRYLSVGLATALTYLAPILSITAAMVFLRERPGPTIFIGVLLGFAGIVLMLYPALVGAELRDGTLIGIGAGIAMAATNALSRVQVKDLTRTEPPAAIALSFAIICSLVGLATALFGWVDLGAREFVLLAGAGFLGGLGHVLMMESVARAPVSVLAPYEYTGIIWAFGFDLLLLGIAPSAWALTGALVVVAAAAIVAYGQGRFARKTTASA
ncbi:DMT family transporter [Devosia sp.]|uniref:DMT family transporter n=1 Tax=Devosia sp. TaxID=1871048 RepID=UPI001B2C044A|nr:DMT family transporter [Devosia sp.]MBO9587744.1 DMT family transporter [Devosia sp.]